MNSITGYVSRIVSVSPGGGSIFTLNQRTGKSMKVVASYDVQSQPPALGTCLEITGSFEESSFGAQFIALSLVPIQPWNNEIVPLLSMHPLFQFFSWRRCEKMWRQSGTDLYHALDNFEFEYFASKLSPSEICNLFKAWESYAFLTSLVAYLSSKGIPALTAQPLLKLYGAEAINKLKVNPYRLSMVLDWETADQICQTNPSASSYENERYIAAVVWVLSQFRKQGHTSVEQRKILAKLAQTLGGSYSANKALNTALEARKCVYDDKIKGRIQGITIAKIEAELIAILRPPSPLVTPLNRNDAAARCSPRLIAQNVRHAVELALELGKSLFRANGQIGRSIASHKNELIVHVGLRDAREAILNHGMSASGYTYKDIIAGRVTSDHSAQTLLALVHNVERLDVLTLNKILRKIPEKWSWCLITDFDSIRNEGLGNCIDLLGASSLPHFGLGEHFVGHRSASPINILQLKVWLDSHGTSTTPVGGLRFIETNTLTATSEEIIGCYNEAVVDGTAVILTATAKAASNINDILQRDHLAVRRFKKLDCTEIRLRPGTSVCIGSPVYAKTARAQRVVLAGEHGVVTEIYKPPLIIYQADGQATSQIGSLTFEKAGPYTLYADELAQLDLGFAAPVRYRPHAMVDDVIVYLEQSNLMTARAIWAACTLAKRRCILIGNVRDVNWLEHNSLVDKDNQDEQE